MSDEITIDLREYGTLDPQTGKLTVTPDGELALKQAIAAKTGRAVDTIQIKKVWAEATVKRADGRVEDLGIVSSSEPSEVTWKGDGHAGRSG